MKVIDKRKAKKDSYVTKNLRREGQIQQMIRHPNITQLLDILDAQLQALKPGLKERPC